MVPRKRLHLVLTSRYGCLPFFEAPLSFSVTNSPRHCCRISELQYKFFYIPTAPEEPDLVIATIRNLTAMQGYTHVVFSGFEFQEAVQRVGDVPTWSSGLASPSFDPYAA